MTNLKNFWKMSSLERFFCISLSILFFCAMPLANAEPVVAPSIGGETPQNISPATVDTEGLKSFEEERIPERLKETPSPEEETLLTEDPAAFIGKKFGNVWNTMKEDNAYKEEMGEEDGTRKMMQFKF